MKNDGTRAVRSFCRTVLRRKDGLKRLKRAARSINDDSFAPDSYGRKGDDGNECGCLYFHLLNRKEKKKIFSNGVFADAQLGLKIYEHTFDGDTIEELKNLGAKGMRKVIREEIKRKEKRLAAKK